MGHFLYFWYIFLKKIIGLSRVSSSQFGDLTQSSGTVFYALYISLFVFVSAICRLEAVGIDLPIF